MKKIFLTQDSFGLFILRICIGLMFMTHGSQKLFGAFGGSGIVGTANLFSGMGLPNPTLQAYLAGGSEFFGGLFLTLGLLTRLAVFPPLVVMIVAITKVHWVHGFFMQKGGFEYPLMIVGALVALLSLGGGKFSVDRKIGKPR